jgi:hypothetical protein
MKFIHTSDWHLGRRLGEHALLDDQRVFCDCLVELAVDEGPNWWSSLATSTTETCPPRRP